MNNRSPQEKSKKSHDQSPALFLPATSTSLSSLSKTEQVLRDAKWLNQLCEFAFHPDIAGTRLASHVEITKKMIYRYETQSTKREFTLTTPVSQSADIQFPNNKQINQIIMNTQAHDAACLKQLIHLLRVPLHLYLQTCVDCIPAFLLPHKPVAKSISVNYQASLCLSLLIDDDFPPEPVRLLLRDPELRTQLYPENAKLLDQIAHALGVAIASYAGNNYSHHGFGCDSKLPHKAEFVKMLIGKGANLNAVKYGDYPQTQTPVSAAAYHHETDILKLLVESGANVNLPQNGAESPLLCASKNGNSDIVAILLTSPDVDVNVSDDRVVGGYHEGEGHCPLMKAIRNLNRGRDDNRENYLNVIKQLVDHPDIDIHKPSQMGKTAIREAIYWCHQDVLKILLSSDKVSDEDRKNALVYARELYEPMRGVDVGSDWNRERRTHFREIIKFLTTACDDLCDRRVGLN